MGPNPYHLWEFSSQVGPNFVSQVGPNFVLSKGLKYYIVPKIRLSFFLKKKGINFFVQCKSRKNLLFDSSFCQYFLNTISYFFLSAKEMKPV